MSHYKYRVASYIETIELHQGIGIGFRELHEVTVRYFNKIDSAEKFMFLEKLKGKEVQLLDMDEVRAVGKVIEQQLIIKLGTGNEQN